MNLTMSNAIVELFKGHLLNGIKHSFTALIMAEIKNTKTSNPASLLFVTLFILISNVRSLTPVTDLPLKTSSRWIVSAKGERVKFACVSWVAHLEPMVAEGLNKQPLDAISKKIAGMGFNCVRLTYPIYLVTDETMSNMTVRQSFTNLGLTKDIAGFETHNPNLLNFTLIDAFKEVVSSLGNNSVMVILDNHLSKPGWCCAYDDNNGFFGDKYFDADTWIRGLTKMATMFNGTRYVVGMSLRNELRGVRSNVMDWYRYMRNGSEAVHSANPSVLVIISGLNFDNDLSHLQTRPMSLNFTGKAVYELHSYAFSEGNDWVDNNLNDECGAVESSLYTRGGFLLDKGFPLFLSEFGGDMRGTNVNDNRFFDCFLALLAFYDMDWAYWTLAGSYYTRQGVADSEEFYGMLTSDWSSIRNATFLKRLSVLQSPFRGPGESWVPHKLLFHSKTGTCIRRVSPGAKSKLKLGDCLKSENWMYTRQQTLTIRGTNYCVRAEGEGKAATLGTSCTTSASKWDAISASKLHLSSKLSARTRVCLDARFGDTITTGACECLTANKTCDPATQWFTLVDTNRKPNKGPQETPSPS